MTMRTMIGVDIHFGPDSITHKYHPADDKCHAYGVLKIDSGGATYANLYFDTDPAHVDAVIAELVALRAEMDPPGAVPPASAQMAEFAEIISGRNPYEQPAPITDSGRTCGQANPGTGAWCHRDGDHGVHEDTNGDTWRTDGDGPAPGERCLEHSDPADDLYGQCVKRGPHKMHENVHHQQWSKPFRPAPAPGPAGGPFWCPATTGPDDELDQTLARS